MCGETYLDNGDIITFTGQGTHDSSGANKRRTQSVNQNADGRTYDVKGEIDLTTRTWTGKFVKRS